MVILFFKLTTAKGTSHKAIQKLAEEVESKVLATLSPSSPIQTIALSSPSNGVESDMKLTIDLKPWNKCHSSSDSVIREINSLLNKIPELKGSANLSGSFSTKAKPPVQLSLSGDNHQEINNWVTTLKKQAESVSGINHLETDYSESSPHLMMTVNRLHAELLGISTSSIANTLSTLLIGKKISSFTEKGEIYDIIIQSAPDEFNYIQDLGKVYMQTQSGKSVSLDSLISVSVEGQPYALHRYNRKNSITLSANLNSGYSLSQVLPHLHQLAIDNSPAHACIDFRGESLAFIQSQQAMFQLFLITIIIIYLILAAQFESFWQPLVIILAIPPALTGALASMQIAHLEINFFSQIALILLSGLSVKNTILVVEFINQLRNKSIDLDAAIIEGSAQRLRPILMTAITTLVGCIPLMMSSGPGSESKQIIGTVLFYGMLSSLFMTIFVLPASYRIIMKAK